MRKVLSWVAVLFLVFFVVKNPTGAAAAAKGIGNGLLGVAAGVSSFLTAVAS